MSTLLAVTAQTNAELVGRAVDGDASAWDLLVDRFTRLVWHVILGFRELRTETQADIHQTTWLKLAQNLENIRQPEQLGSWLATTARRECLRESKLLAREVVTDTFETLATDGSLETHLLESERDATLWDVFRKLGAECQQLLRLFVAEPPFTYDEIEAILGIKRGSIAKRKKECLDGLRSNPRIQALADSDEWMERR